MKKSNKLRIIGTCHSLVHVEFFCRSLIACVADHEAHIGPRYQKQLEAGKAERLQAELDELKRGRSEPSGAVIDEERENRKLRAEVERLQGSEQMLKGLLNKYEEDINRLDADSSMLRSKEQASVEANKWLQEDNQRLKLERGLLEDKKKAGEEALRLLGIENKNLKAELQSLHDSQERIREITQELNAERKKHRDQVLEQALSLQQFETEGKQLKAELLRKEAELADITRRYDDLEQEMGNMKAESAGHVSAATHKSLKARHEAARRIQSYERGRQVRKKLKDATTMDSMGFVAFKTHLKQQGVDAVLVDKALSKHELQKLAEAYEVQDPDILSASSTPNDYSVLVEQLEEQNQILSAEVRMHQALLEQKSDEMNLLISENQSLLQDKERIAQENQLLEEKVRKTTDALALANAQCSGELRSELMAAREAEAVSVAEIGVLQKQLAGIHREKDALLADLTQLEQLLSTSQAEAEDAKQELLAQQHSLQQAASLKSELEAANNHLAHTMEDHKTLTTLKLEHANLSVSHDQLQLQHKKLCVEYDTTRQQMSEALTRVQEMEVELLLRERSSESCVLQHDPGAVVQPQPPQIPRSPATSPMSQRTSIQSQVLNHPMANTPLPKQSQPSKRTDDEMLVTKMKEAIAVGDVLTVQELTPEVKELCTTTDQGYRLVPDIADSLNRGCGSEQPIHTAVLLLLLSIAEQSIQAVQDITIDPLLKIACSDFVEGRLLATDLLVRLSSKASVRGAVRIKGAIPTLLLNLLPQKQDASQEAAELNLLTSRLFVNLSVSNKNKKAISDGGGVSMLLGQLESMESGLQQTSIRVLANLAVDKTICLELYENKACESICNALEHFLINEDHVGIKYAARCLGLMITTLGSRAIMVGVHDALLAVLGRFEGTHHTSLEQVIDDAIKSLLTVIEDDCVRSGCCSRPGVLALLMELIATGHRPALQLVSALSHDVGCQQSLVAAGGLRVLFECLDRDQDWINMALEAIAKLCELEEASAELSLSIPGILMDCAHRGNCVRTVMQTLRILARYHTFRQVMIEGGAVEFASTCLDANSGLSDKVCASELLHSLSLEYESERRAQNCGVLPKLLECVTEPRWSEKEVMVHSIRALCNFTLGQGCCQAVLSRDAVQISSQIIVAHPPESEMARDAARLLRNMLTLDEASFEQAQRASAALVQITRTQDVECIRYGLQCLRSITIQPGGCESVLSISNETMSHFRSLLDIVDVETKECNARIMLQLSLHPAICSQTWTKQDTLALVEQIGKSQNHEQQVTEHLAATMWQLLNEFELINPRHFGDCDISCLPLNHLCQTAMDGANSKTALLSVHLLGALFYWANCVVLPWKASHSDIVGRSLAQCGKWIQLDAKQLRCWMSVLNQMPEHCWASFAAANGLAVVEVLLRGEDSQLVSDGLQFVLDIIRHLPPNIVYDVATPSLIACCQLCSSQAYIAADLVLDAIADVSATLNN